MIQDIWDKIENDSALSSIQKYNILANLVRLKDIDQSIFDQVSQFPTDHVVFAYLASGSKIMLKKNAIHDLKTLLYRKNVTTEHNQQQAMLIYGKPIIVRKHTPLTSIVSDRFDLRKMLVLDPLCSVQQKVPLVDTNILTLYGYPNTVHCHNVSYSTTIEDAVHHLLLSTKHYGASGYTLNVQKIIEVVLLDLHTSVTGSIVKKYLVLSHIDPDGYLSSVFDDIPAVELFPQTYAYVNDYALFSTLISVLISTILSYIQWKTPKKLEGGEISFGIVTKYSVTWSMVEQYLKYYLEGVYSNANVSVNDVYQSITDLDILGALQECILSLSNVNTYISSIMPVLAKWYIWPVELRKCRRLSEILDCIMQHDTTTSICKFIDNFLCKCYH